MRCIPALQQLKASNSDQETGIKIVANALRMPCKQIAQNAGVDASVVVNKVSEGNQSYGYDALNGEYVNMIEKGIIDPTKVNYLHISNRCEQHTSANLSVCRLCERL